MGSSKVNGEIQVRGTQRYLRDYADSLLETIPQRDIVTYGIAQNRLNPLAGVWSSAVFNTFRRTRGQILYWGVPLLVGYSAMQWAIER